WMELFSIRIQRTFQLVSTGQMLDPVNDCQPAQRAATCRRSDTGSKIYLFICSMIQETNDLKI
ncbi:hypothetical protein, partial [Phocaeicola vulgatus]|uniref:hypothetical protein n=1 Tax=Phocaeicola vulgatus TaxID=821 RepID=UPI0032BFDE24